jgi:hypothetical protein
MTKNTFYLLLAAGLVAWWLYERRRAAKPTQAVGQPVNWADRPNSLFT